MQLSDASGCQRVGGVVVALLVFLMLAFDASAQIVQPALVVQKQINGSSALDSAQFRVSVSCAGTDITPAGGAVVSVSTPLFLYSVPVNAACTVTELPSGVVPGYVYPAAPAGYQWQQPVPLAAMTITTTAAGEGSAVLSNTLVAAAATSVAIVPVGGWPIALCIGLALVILGAWRLRIA